jgi:pimeloyl-ACP methyl ester carboxylesterase
MKHHFSYLIVISSLVIVTMTTACAASTPAIIPTISNPFDEKVDVGGYALRIHCIGRGSPTVVVETGFGEPGVERETSSWINVANEIEKKTRICVYDRAGLGSSDVAPGENRTSQDMAKDLHTLLVNANVPSPYILVGHSLGGFNVRVFASEYADTVVGMVLVDSSHPDQWSAINAVLPPESSDEPESLKRIRIIPPASLPEKMDILTSINQVSALKSLGNLPLVVLTHSPTWSIDPNLSPELSGKIERIWEKQQNELASLSSNGSLVVATRAGHYIQVDEPQLVIDAILKVIEEVKK